MKALAASLLIAIAPALALAQASPAKPAAAKKHAPAHKPKKDNSAAVKAVEEGVPLEEPDPAIKLSDAEIEISKKIYIGEFPCELGANVKIRALKREGFFLVSNKLNRFVMHPVESRTGAIRLEDPVRGAMFLQLGNKSMLMSQKLGQRLADECHSPEQVKFAEEMKNKPPINLLEPSAPKSGPN